MAWTYDPGALDLPLNAVRLVIGDTNVSDPQLQDEEIQLFIDSSDTTQSAALLAVQALAARYARYVDKWVGDLKLLASQRYRAYREMLNILALSSGVSGIPYAGGIRIGDKQAFEEGDDIVQPEFRRNMHDFYGDPG